MKSSDILSDYEPGGTGGNRSSNGGQLTPKDVHNYQPPVGPSNINDSKSPGLHGSNHGNCGTQGKR